MQHVRQVQVTHVFSRTAPDVVLLLNTDNLAYLADVRIIFWLEATFPNAYLQTSEVDDLRVYFDGEDITTKFTEALSEALTKSALARQQYADALQRWMQIFDNEAPLAGLPAHRIAENRTLASKYPIQDWGSFFKKLATTNFGYRGSLHPLHYIYRDIQIAPLSLRQVLYPSAKDNERPLNKLRDSRLVISHGPSRLYSKNWSPVEAQRQGIATIAASMIYDDMWELEMRERVLRTAGQMAEVSDQLMELQRKYTDFEERAAEFKAIADGIDASLTELLACQGPATRVSRGNT